MKADDANLSTDGELRTLGVDDIPQCVHVMAQAFADSPAYKVCFCVYYVNDFYLEVVV